MTATPTELPHRRDVFPTLIRNLVSFYDFEHPVPGSPARERDLGRSGTDLDLINGGARMRVPDAAYPCGRNSLQTKQVSPGVSSTDDWKAGVYSATGFYSAIGLAGVL
ncbi:MAG: LamG-like jellyroll fold domain-containing protein, partial [Stackebrandtia sp.]